MNNRKTFRRAALGAAIAGSLIATSLLGSAAYADEGRLKAPGAGTGTLLVGDGDTDGRDFLYWQRGNSPNP